MSNQMDMQGEIAARSKEGGGIKIGETWYNTWAKGVTFPDSWKPGAKVRFLYTKNGRYNNIVEGKAKLLAESTGRPSGGGGGGGGRSNAGPEIMSQNALTNAVALVNGQDHVFENMNLGAIVAITVRIQAVFAKSTKAIAAGETPEINDLIAALGQSAPAESSGGGDDWGSSGSSGGSDDGFGGGQASAPASDWDDDIPF